MACCTLDKTHMTALLCMQGMRLKASLQNTTPQALPRTQSLGVPQRHSRSLCRSSFRAIHLLDKMHKCTCTACLGQNAAGTEPPPSPPTARRATNYTSTESVTHHPCITIQRARTSACPHTVAFDPHTCA